MRPPVSGARRPGAGSTPGLPGGAPGRPTGPGAPAQAPPAAAAGAGRRGRGFTLVELVAVLAIVGLLAAAALPLQQLALRRAQEQALREALRTLRGALDEHRRLVEARRIAAGPEGSPWPATLDDLVRGLPTLDA